MDKFFKFMVYVYFLLAVMNLIVFFITFNMDKFVIGLLFMSVFLNEREKYNV